MSVIWPWNVRRVAGVIVALVPGESFHQYARRLVNERYGPDTEMIVTELDVDGDQAHAEIHVRQPIAVQNVAIQITTVPIKASDDA